MQSVIKIIIFFIILFGGAISIYLVDKYWQPKINESICDEILDIKDRDRCYYDVAIEKWDSLLCSKIEKLEFQRNKCYYDIATKTKNVKLCEEIRNNSWLKTQCYKEISPELVKPDLIINQVRTHPSPLRYGHDKVIYFDIEVKNIGIKTIEESVKIQVKGESMPEHRVATLYFSPTVPMKPGSVKTITISYPLNFVGKRNFLIQVDPFDKIDEVNEENNQLVYSVSVK